MSSISFEEVTLPKAQASRRLSLGVGLSIGAVASIGMWAAIGLGLKALFF